MRVLVCGGRDFSDRRYLAAALEELHAQQAFTLVVTGGASGADALADDWAKRKGIDRAIFPANWGGRGVMAGPHRNALMLFLGQPEIVVAFPGGRGTADMVLRAERESVPVMRLP